MSQPRSNNTQDNEIFQMGNQTYTSITYFKSNWKLFNVFIPAFLLRIAAGLVISWTLYSNIQPNFSSAKIKGFSTIFYVGSILGALIIALTVFKIEKKIFNYISSTLIIVHGILSLIAYNDLYGLIIGNLLSGVAYGLISISSAIHASEISISSKRGRHVASLQVGITLGVLIGLQVSVETIKNSVPNQYLFWLTNGIILILCGILSIGSTSYFFMESSIFWIHKGNNIEARNIMLKYRNEIYETFDIANDLQMMNAYVQHGAEEINMYIPSISFDKQKYMKFIKIALIRITYAFGTALTINIILISYETWLIGSSEGIVTYLLPRFLTEITIILFIDRFGRRWPLIISTVVCGLLLIAIAVLVMNVQGSTDTYFSNSIFFALGILIIFYQSFIGFGLSMSSQILAVEVFDFYSKPFFNYLLLVIEHISYITVILYLNTQYFNIVVYFFTTAFFQLITGFVTWYYIKETKNLNILTSSTLFK